MVSQPVAPTPKDASRNPLGTARKRLRGRDHDDGKNENCQGEATRDQGAAVGDAAQSLYKNRQAQESVDDRRHPGEVANVRNQESVHRRVLGVLLEVDRRRHPEGKSQHDDESDEDQRTDEALRKTGSLGASGEWAGQEIAEACRQHRPAFSDHIDNQGY